MIKTILSVNPLNSVTTHNTITRTTYDALPIQPFLLQQILEALANHRLQIGIMAVSETTSPVRISKIAGRYLLFDAEDVASLRRHQNINGVLVGTAPQQPSQNIFLGLPVELRPEEAEALVEQDAAYLVDDVAAHRAVLQNPSSDARKAYLDSLKTRKQTAHKVFAEKNALKSVRISEKRGGAGSSRSQARNTTTEDEDALFPSGQPEPSTHPAGAPVKSLGVTPTSSGPLISPSAEQTFGVGRPPNGPLCRFLLTSGFYMTPGLRFGSKYSVYPGDPLRFHAHFMANQFDWNEEMAILDIVAGGRLATAVKKAYVMGGQQPAVEAERDAQVRTFSIEWAAM